MERHGEIAARPTEDGLGFELYNDYFGLTCNHETFQGHYDKWPFCKPYDAEEWWVFMDEPEAKQAARDLTVYLSRLPVIVAPPRISFGAVCGGAFELRNNGRMVGMHLFKGNDKNTTWPFGKNPQWPIYGKREDAMKAMIKLQTYLDGRIRDIMRNKQDAAKAAETKRKKAKK